MDKKTADDYNKLFKRIDSLDIENRNLKKQIVQAEKVLEMVIDNTKMPHQHKDYYERLCCLTERASEYFETTKELREGSEKWNI